MMKLQDCIPCFAALQTYCHTSFSAWNTTESYSLKAYMICPLYMRNIL